MHSPNRIHAAGLGLILFSPAAVASVADGEDFMAALEPGGGRYDDLVASQRVVLLGTGSPQLNYVIHVRTENAPRSPVFEQTRFGMRIDRALSIRDGYAPMEWQRTDPDELRFDVPPGYYAVDASWLGSGDQADVDMVVDLLLTECAYPIPGDGWPALMYDVNREAAG